jgi:hypothetical protein
MGGLEMFDLENRSALASSTGFSALSYQPPSYGIGDERIKEPKNNNRERAGNTASTRKVVGI